MYLNGTAILDATNATWTFTSSSPGFYNVYINVTDHDSVTAISNTASVVVNSPPSVAIVPGTHGGMDVGQTKMVLSNVSQGVPSYAYQWYLNGSAVSGATSANWFFTPSSTGTFDMYVNVTDSVNFTVKSNVLAVTVYPVPSISISPDSAALDVGQSQLFTASVSGGLSPYTFQWCMDGVMLGHGDAQSWTFVFNAAGNCSIQAVVTDSFGVQVTSNTATVTVYNQVPEFPVALILPLFIIATLLTAIVSRRKRKNDQNKRALS